MANERPHDDLNSDTIFRLLARACTILQADQLPRGGTWHLASCGGPHVSCAPRCETLAQLLWDAQCAGVVLPHRVEPPASDTPAASASRGLHYVQGKALP